MGRVEKKRKVSYQVKWRGFPGKKNWTYENYETSNSVGAEEESWKCHSNNPKSPKNSVSNIKMVFVPNGFSTLEYQGKIWGL
jgi:hypothetical protein